MKILPSLLGSIFVSVFAHLAVFAVPVDLTPGVLDPSFSPGSGANNTVTTAVIGPDDAIWIGGRFTEVDGQGRYGVARLNPNGAVDPTFVSPLGPSDEVQALAVLPDNKGIVASLRTADTNLAIAFISQDGGGVRKLGFDANIVIRSAHAVSSIVVLGDGETIVTADWDGLVFFRPDGAGGYSQRRITAFGSSTAFDPSIASLTVDGLGRPMVAGAFSSIDGSVQSYFARFLPNGDLDPAFRPNLPFTPPAPMMGFTFWGATTLTDGSVVSADIVNRQFFRLSPEGEIDPDFERTTLPNLGTPLYPTVIRNPRVVPLPNQYTLFYSVDPRFTSHGYASYMYRVRSDGSLASGWEVVFSPTDGIQDVVADRRGNVIMVGSFTNVLGSPLRGVARLHGGAVDAPPVLPAPPARIEVREGDDVVLPLHPTSFADPFTAQWFLGNSPIADQTNPRLAVRSIRPDQAGLYSLQVSNRFGSTRTPATEIVVRPYPIQRGAVDLNFERPLLTSIIPQVALRQPDGKWLVSGRWSPQNLFGVNSLSPFTLRRLLANGPLDPEFRPSFLRNDSTAHNIAALALQSDGKILVGGSMLPSHQPGVRYLLRLHPDASLDSGFDGDTNLLTASVNRPPLLPAPLVTGIHPHPTGRILICGRLYQTNIPNAAIALQTNGLIDWEFTRRLPMGAAEAMVGMPDGRCVLAGRFFLPSGSESPIVRVLIDGTLDDSFLFPPLEMPWRWHQLVKVDDDGACLMSIFNYETYTTRVLQLDAKGSLVATWADLQTPLGGPPRLVALPGPKVLAGWIDVPATDRPLKLAMVGPRAEDRWEATRSFPALPPFLPGQSTLFMMAPDPEGGVLAGGIFGEIDGVPRPGLARLHFEASVPAAPYLLRPQRAAAGRFQVEVSTSNHQTYELQRAFHVIGGPWTSVHRVTGNGASQMLMDPAATEGAAFYRVLVGE